MSWGELIGSSMPAIGVVMFFHKNKQVVCWSQLILSGLLALIVTTNQLGVFESNFFWVMIIANAGFGMWGLTRNKKP